MNNLGCMFTQGEIDVRPFLLYTELPELWEIFNEIISISTIDSNGFLSLSALDVYLKYNSIEITVNKRDFFYIMSYFLDRQNEYILNKRKRKRSENDLSKNKSR
jgi:hypothetical protein